MFYRTDRTQVIADRNFTLLGFFKNLLCSCYFDLDPMTFICDNTNLTRISLRYTGCANTNFLRQGFRKLSSDTQTDRHDRNYIPRSFAGGKKIGTDLTKLPPWGGSLVYWGHDVYYTIVGSQPIRITQHLYAYQLHCKELQDANCSLSATVQTQLT